MKLGDVIEVLAAACFVAAAILSTRLLWPGLIVAGFALAYFAQVTAGTPINIPRLPKLRRRLRRGK